LKVAIYLCMRESALSAILIYASIKTMLIAIYVFKEPTYKTDYKLYHDNAEAILAAGQKLKFATVGVYELELIPGVGDKLANSILAKRSHILDCSKSTQNKKCPESPFEVVKGVGPKTAAKLETYLQIESR
jgi:hypothetical protein